MSIKLSSLPAFTATVRSHHHYWMERVMKGEDLYHYVKWSSQPPDFILLGTTVALHLAPSNSPSLRAKTLGCRHKLCHLQYTDYRLSWFSLKDRVETLPVQSLLVYNCNTLKAEVKKMCFPPIFQSLCVAEYGLTLGEGKAPGLGQGLCLVSVR